MNILSKLKNYILPKEIDFFGNLTKQCRITENTVNELYNLYINQSGNVQKVYSMISEAKQMRINNLIELNGVLITPVDKEAISRIYINLHWIVLSVKHLDVEISTYNIKTLKEYENIFLNLKQQMNDMTLCFKLLNEKKYDDVLRTIYQIIHQDNLLIKEYSLQLAELFNKSDMKYIFQHKEILSQLKEISKRIHFCANSVEDIVFKMN